MEGGPTWVLIYWWSQMNLLRLLEWTQTKKKKKKSMRRAGFRGSGERKCEREPGRNLPVPAFHSTVSSLASLGTVTSLASLGTVTSLAPGRDLVSGFLEKERKKKRKKKERKKEKSHTMNWGSLQWNRRHEHKERSQKWTKFLERGILARIKE